MNMTDILNMVEEIKPEDITDDYYIPIHDHKNKITKKIKVSSLINFKKIDTEHCGVSNQELTRLQNLEYGLDENGFSKEREYDE